MLNSRSSKEREQNRVFKKISFLLIVLTKCYSFLSLSTVKNLQIRFLYVKSSQ